MKKKKKVIGLYNNELRHLSNLVLVSLKILFADDWFPFRENLQEII